MDDLISRQAAIEAVNDVRKKLMEEGVDVNPVWKCADALHCVPTADLSEYCDKLWKTAYERGKAEAHPKKGKWKHRKNWSMYVCDQCSFENHEASKYCPNCGARMEESDEHTD